MDHEALKDFSLFDDMSEDELKACAELFEPIRRMAGERVTREADFGYSLFLVMAGRFEVEIDGEIVAELNAGDHFGEVSLVTGEKRNATVRALETSDLAKIMCWDFEELMLRNAGLAERVKAVAAARS